MKNALILLSNRLIKLFANLLKGLCYVFHFFFPNKRFTLPRHAKPLWRTKKHYAIPRKLWQTNYTNRVTLPVYLNYLFNRLLAYDFDHYFVITEERADFIRENFSKEIFEAYSRIQIGAAQADFWRLLVLYREGGVYMDIDAHLVWRLSAIVTPEKTELYLMNRAKDLTNYFIASEKDNPNLKKMIDLVMKNIEENTLTNVFDLTGPGILNQVLDLKTAPTTYFRYTCNQGSFTNDYFQYVDKPEGKWTTAQHKIDIIRKQD